MHVYTLLVFVIGSSGLSQAQQASWTSEHPALAFTLALPSGMGYEPQGSKHGAIMELGPRKHQTHGLPALIP